MFGRRMGSRHRKSDEPEKPFWISFADLMTGVMVIFLVTMALKYIEQPPQCPPFKQCYECPTCVTTVPESFRTVSNGVDNIKCTEFIEKNIDKATFPDVTIQNFSVFFGSATQFKHNDHCLNRSQRKRIREITKIILTAAKDSSCEGKIKRYLVEGFTDPSGSYLANLVLSQQRSTSVMLALLEPDADSPLIDDEVKMIPKSFVVDGYSYQSNKLNPEESRRVEYRLLFDELTSQQGQFSPVGERSVKEIIKGWKIHMDRLQCQI